MKEAHSLSANLGIKHVIYESDNQELINICKGKDSNWQITPIIQGINKLKNSSSVVVYAWCSLEANQAADQTAKLCKSFNLPRL